MRRFLPLVFCLFSLKTSYQQIVASADTTICAGGTAILSIISAPSYGTSSYTFEVYPYAPEPYAGISPVKASGGGLNDDSISVAINLGFNFCFMGNSYSKCFIGANGWVSFGGPGALAPTYYSAPIPSTSPSVPKNCIMGPWIDWNPGLCSPLGSCIKYQTTGVAPNRKFVVSWDNVPMFSCTGLLGKTQIVLNETSNIIDNHLTNKPVCMGWGGGTSTQGVHSLDGLTAFTAPGRNSTVWTATNESTRFIPHGITWYADGVIVGYGDSIAVSPDETTVYTATLTACDGTEEEEDVVVTVIDNDPAFEYELFYCTDGFAVPVITGTPGGTFTSTPGGLIWDATTGIINLDLSMPGFYTITYAFAGICATSESDVVVIIPYPNAAFGYADSVFCPVGTATPSFITTPTGTFTVSPPGLVINAATGVIDLSTGVTGTTYTITYTVGDACESVFSFDILITPTDVADFAYGASSYCPSGSTFPVFISTPDGTFTVFPPSLDVDPVSGLIDLTSGIPGITYTITYSTPAGPCMTSATFDITIDPLDDAGFAYSALSYCPSGIMPPVYINTPGGTFTISPPTMAIDAASGTVYLASGDVGTVYTITYSTPAGPCRNTSTQTIEIDPPDDPYFCYTATDFCNYGTAFISVLSTPGGTFSVSPYLAVDPITGTIDLSTGTPGSVYTITYTTPAGLCSTELSIAITILPLTDAAFAFDNIGYCASGTKLPLIVNSGGSFSADAGILINSSTGELDLSSCLPGGPYNIYYASPGCSETDTISLLIYPLPEPTITVPEIICLEGDAVTLFGDPAGGFFSGDGVSGNEFDPQLAGNSGVYPATYTYTDLNGCAGTATADIQVIRNSVDAGTDIYIAEYTTAILNATGGSTFLWEPPAGLSCPDCASTVVDTLFTTTYMVTSWDDYGCVDSDNIIVHIVPVLNTEVFIPNTFTPNGDNINDFFFAFGTDLVEIVSMNIYDRWGEHLFSAENIGKGEISRGWNGEINGMDADQGVYAYIMEVLLVEGIKQQISGNITLIR